MCQGFPSASGMLFWTGWRPISDRAHGTVRPELFRHRTRGGACLPLPGRMMKFRFVHPWHSRRPGLYVRSVGNHRARPWGSGTFAGRARLRRVNRSTPAGWACDQRHRFLRVAPGATATLHAALLYPTRNMMQVPTRAPSDTSRRPARLAPEGESPIGDRAASEAETAHQSLVSSAHFSADASRSAPGGTRGAHERRATRSVQAERIRPSQCAGPGTRRRLLAPPRPAGR